MPARKTARKSSKSAKSAAARFPLTVGSYAKVGHGNADQTAGGLTRKDLIQNKHGRWVSKAKHEWGKKHGAKQLAKAGYALFTKGGVGKVRRVARRA